MNRFKSAARGSLPMRVRLALALLAAALPAVQMAPAMAQEAAEQLAPAAPDGTGPDAAPAESDVALAPAPASHARARRETAARTSATPATPGEAASATSTTSTSAAHPLLPVPPETASITHHRLKLDGRTLRYTATAGNLLIRNAASAPQASIFYVAYTLDAAGAAKRPVTFLYNGGPGAGSAFLMLGSFGPKRVLTASPAATAPAPYTLVDNPDSLLDKSDLVFIDAVGTGFSRPVGHATDKDFWGVDQDVAAFRRFIERYLSVNERWNSPKFLYGESYGTTRSAALAYALQRDGVALNGVVLMSSVLNYGAHMPGYDFSFIHNLPTYAAIAWYHDKITPRPADLPAFLEQARAFARGPYAQALMEGDALPAADQAAMAQRVAYFTGLSPTYVAAAKLRVGPAHFRKELLRGEALTLGRYDARATGIDQDSAGGTPDYDASYSGIISAFEAALHQHLARDLHYHNDAEYLLGNSHATVQWDWHHRAWWGEHLQLPDTAADLAQAMRENPHLKVLSANGYFDLATPFFATEYDLAHMGLNAAQRANLRITYYNAGHMIYLNVPALHTLKADLARFYDNATAAPTAPPAH